MKQALERGVDPMPGLLEVLPMLKRSYVLGVATSAPMYLAEIVMRKLSIGSFFGVIQTSDGIAKGKPDPEIYQTAMGKLGIDPSETVVLEDSSNGALAGKRAGAFVVAVPSQYTREQDFSFVDERAENLLDAARRIRAL